MKHYKAYKIILTSLIAATLLQMNSVFVNAADTEKPVTSAVFATAEANHEKAVTADSNVKTIDIHIKAEPNSDISQSVQQALNLARDFAADSMPYRIIIPKGTYKLKAPLEIYSNTQIYAVGAHIIKESLGGGMLRTAMPRGGKELNGYNGYRNITVEGGIWDGNSESKTYGEGKCSPFSSFRFAHATNITLKNLSVINNVGSHHVELGGLDGVNITGCTFKGYKSGGVEGGKEAIQLDVMYSSDVFVGFPSFDDTPCKNVKITNNKFISVNRGVGNHTAVMGVYFDNIQVTDNYFEDINQQAVLCLNWRNSDISKNTMKNVGSGVDFKSMEPGLYHNLKTGKATVSAKSKTTISNNSISVRRNAEKALPYVFGIRAWGNTVTSSNNPNKLPVGKYCVEDVTISNNKITAYGKINGGISGRLMNSCTVYGNIINFADSQNNENARGIYLKQSSKNRIENNICQKIIGAGGNGIHLVEGSNNNTIKTNTVTDCSGSGISINSSSANNTITGGAVKGNSKNGISLNSVSGNKVQQIKDITGNGCYGVAVSSSQKNKINDVKVNSSGKSGILLSGSSSDNALTETVSQNNKDSGITISDSQKNSVTSSSFSSNKSYGISITGKSKNNSSKSCKSNNNSKGQIAISNSCSGNTVDSFSTTTAVKGIQPSVPQELKLTSRTSTTITLNWNQCKNASGYIIYRKNSDGKYTKIKIINKNSTLTFTDKNLTPNKKYSYRVTSYYSSNNNTVISAYEKTLIKTTRLSAPSNLSATTTKNAVKLTWSRVTGANGYFVYKYNSKTKTYTKIVNIGGGNVLTIKNSGLSPNTKYTYKIAAYIKSGNSYLSGDFSKTVTATTKK